MSAFRGTYATGCSIAIAVVLTAATAFAEQPVPDGGAEAAPPSQAARPSATVVYIRDERAGALGPRYRSPGLAAALSLTPVPVDFGNLYAENVPWGLAYTSAELALGTGMMWLGAAHMCHRGDECGDWSDSETVGMIGLATAYVAVKIVAGVHAASAAREFNERAALVWAPVVAPSRGGAALSAVASF